MIKSKTNTALAPNAVVRWFQQSLRHSTIHNKNSQKSNKKTNGTITEACSPSEKGAVILHKISLFFVLVFSVGRERERERGTLGNPKILAGFFWWVLSGFRFWVFLCDKGGVFDRWDKKRRRNKKKKLKNKIEWEWKWREREGDEEVLQRFSQSSWSWYSACQHFVSSNFFIFLIINFLFPCPELYCEVLLVYEFLGLW